jgi:hypothetical protein
MLKNKKNKKKIIGLNLPSPNSIILCGHVKKKNEENIKILGYMH